jgi:histidyl-tRNA synthetase
LPTSTKPPGGTRDFLPDDVRRREHVVGTVRRVYEQYGYEPLETPAFENIETLLGKYGEEGNRLIFKILRRGEQAGTGEADLALRYDLTVPLARVVAQYQNELPKFFKRYQIQPVWRADRPARGRFREFYQCDIDAIGSTSQIVEAEQLGAVSEILIRLGFEDFVIRLNHRRVLSGLLESSGIPAERHADALVALDKLDKLGEEGAVADMVGRGIDRDAALRGLQLAAQPSLDVHRAALEGLQNAAPHLGAVDQLNEIIELSKHTPAAGRIRFDPSLARGLSYYTGAIMEIAVPDLAGSLGGGGRYDNLVGMFLGRDVPACGFSLGLERLIVVMTERNMFPAKVSRGAVDVMIAVLDENLRSDALALAAELRAEKLRVDIYPDAGSKLDKPLKYASGRNVPVLAIVGENERARGEVAVRDLQTRQQENAPRASAAQWIARRVRIEQ